MSHAFYRGVVMHQRLRPCRHRFSYRVHSWLIDLDALPELNRYFPLLGVDRPALISFRQADFGPAGSAPLKARIQAQAEQLGLPRPIHIRLLCNLRAFGYGFNSLAVYFCYDAGEALSAILYEVANTHGERHLYAAPAEGLGTQHQRAHKQLYVSPFLPMACRYRFATLAPGARFRVAIQQEDPHGVVFSALWNGRRSALSWRALATELLRPMALKTSLAIHWQAFQLWLKRVPWFPFTPTGAYRASAARYQQDKAP